MLKNAQKRFLDIRIGVHFTAPVMDPPMVDILISRFSYGNSITRKLRSSCIYPITLNFTLSFHWYTIACWEQCQKILGLFRN